MVVEHPSVRDVGQGRLALQRVRFIPDRDPGLRRFRNPRGNELLAVSAVDRVDCRRCVQIKKTEG